MKTYVDFLIFKKEFSLIVKYFILRVKVFGGCHMALYYEGG